VVDRRAEYRGERAGRRFEELSFFAVGAMQSRPQHRESGQRQSIPETRKNSLVGLCRCLAFAGVFWIVALRMDGDEWKRSKIAGYTPFASVSSTSESASSQ
jgi:hypothetical protein